MTTEIAVRPNGAVQTEGFGEREVRPYSEVASSAVQAREQAAVQARYIVAMQRPRDVENFRVRLLKECRRPGFAEVAEYARPVGKEKNEQTGKWEDKIARGPSIRLIETAVQHFGNIVAEAPVVFEGEESRLVRAQMTDLETNVTWMQDIVVPRRIERRGFADNGQILPPKGRNVINSRKNSSGDTVFLIEATDDEVNVKQSAMISKAQRKNAERLLPADIVQEALTVCRKTREDEDSKDPTGAMRRIVDGFAEFNVEPSELAEYLEKPLDRIQPVERDLLRGIYAAIKSGEMTWEQAIAEKNPTSGSKEAAESVAQNKLAALRKQATTQSQSTQDIQPNKSERSERSPATRLNLGGNK